MIENARNIIKSLLLTWLIGIISPITQLAMYASGVKCGFNFDVKP